MSETCRAKTSWKSKTSQYDTYVTGRSEKKSVQSLEVAEGTEAQQTNEGAFKMYTHTSLIKD